MSGPDADDPTQIVAPGYDALVDRYLEWTDHGEDEPRMRYLARFSARLRDGADVLDLGCGAGVPATGRLAERFRVTGVDVSPAQIARARTLVPAATFVVEDITRLEAPAASYDGVAAFYVLGHLPRQRLPDLLRRIATWLRPGGTFLASFGTADSERWTGDWLGVPMSFSSHPPAVNRSLVEAAGLRVVFDELVTSDEDDQGAVTFQWILAERPGG